MRVLEDFGILRNVFMRDPVPDIDSPSSSSPLLPAVTARLSSTLDTSRPECSTLGSLALQSSRKDRTALTEIHNICFGIGGTETSTKSEVTLSLRGPLGNNLVTITLPVTDVESATRLCDCVTAIASDDDNFMKVGRGRCLKPGAFESLLHDLGMPVKTCLQPRIEEDLKPLDAYKISLKKWENSITTGGSVKLLSVDSKTWAIQEVPLTTLNAPPAGQILWLHYVHPSNNSEAASLDSFRHDILDALVPNMFANDGQPSVPGFDDYSAFSTREFEMATSGEVRSFKLPILAGEGRIVTGGAAAINFVDTFIEQKRRTAHRDLQNPIGAGTIALDILDRLLSKNSDVVRKFEVEAARLQEARGRKGVTIRSEASQERIPRMQRAILYMQRKLHETDEICSILGRATEQDSLKKTYGGEATDLAAVNAVINRLRGYSNNLAGRTEDVEKILRLVTESAQLEVNERRAKLTTLNTILAAVAVPPALAVGLVEVGAGSRWPMLVGASAVSAALVTIGFVKGWLRIRS
jgi:Mg2+ and Co2+ transporter CorA